MVTTSFQVILSLVVSVPSEVADAGVGDAVGRDRSHVGGELQRRKLRGRAGRAVQLQAVGAAGGGEEQQFVHLVAEPEAQLLLGLRAEADDRRLLAHRAGAANAVAKLVDLQRDGGVEHRLLVVLQAVVAHDAIAQQVGDQLHDDFVAALGLGQLGDPLDHAPGAVADEPVHVPEGGVAARFPDVGGPELLAGSRKCAKIGGHCGRSLSR